ncbi:DUF6010 family protein [Rhodohalobacter sulfatireducens]|uniref:CPBP family intramembrane metalloprotease n=1 Tax=Rhodohalobacter sulfatireducens TaxID=2911366 RepID=A0ABS9KHY5_9BACT|nr:DUF6010 family protein [Rhodohalobacter sulfatireducens]MCG2590469.1 hypothetical protein [Rhodohalobacter sulfatireducens]
MTEILIGILVGLVIIISGKITKFDNDESFYPLILIFISLLYILFASIDQGFSVILVETLIAAFFISCAILGFKGSKLWIPIGYALHGFFDILHPNLLNNSGVPAWWPGFCLGIDEVIALYLIWKIYNKKV